MLLFEFPPAELLEKPLEDQPTWSIDRMSLGLCIYITEGYFLIRISLADQQTPLSFSVNV